MPPHGSGRGFLLKSKTPWHGGPVDRLTAFVLPIQQTNRYCHVPTTLGAHYQAFYLPEVCGLPLGLVWPTTIGYEDLLVSIQCLKSDYTHFVQVTQALQPRLAP
jgi:hypothetical protein